MVHENLAKRINHLAEDAEKMGENSLAKILYSVAMCYLCGEEELWELEDTFVELAQEAHLCFERKIIGGTLQ